MRTIQVKRDLYALPAAKLVSFVSDVLELSQDVDNELLRSDRENMQDCFASYRASVASGSSCHLTRNINDAIRLVDHNYLVLCSIVKLKAMIGEAQDAIDNFRIHVGRIRSLSYEPVGKRLGLYITFLDSLKHLGDSDIQALDIRKYMDLMESSLKAWVECREQRSAFKARSKGSNLAAKTKLLKSLLMFTTHLEALSVVSSDSALDSMADVFVEALKPYTIGRSSRVSEEAPLVESDVD